MWSFFQAFVFTFVTSAPNAANTWIVRALRLTVKILFTQLVAKNCGSRRSFFFILVHSADTTRVLSRNQVASTMTVMILPLLFGALTAADGSAAPPVQTTQTWRLPGAPTFHVSSTLSTTPQSPSLMTGPGLLTFRSLAGPSRNARSNSGGSQVTSATGASSEPLAGSSLDALPSTMANAQAAPAAGAPAPVQAQAPVDPNAPPPVDPNAPPPADPNAPPPVDPNAPPAGDASATPAPAEEPDIELVQHRQNIVRLHRPLGIATWATLTVTEVLGTIASVNQRTWFGDGLCGVRGATPIFGSSFGCGGLSTLHGVFAFASVTLYASTGIYALSMPDPERAAEGDSRGALRLRIHKGLAWVHAAGMILMPVLGFLGNNPQTFGIDDTTGNISAGFRSVHEVLGFVTWGALTGAMITELLP